MWGAIIGDMIGSVYEFNNVKKKNFPLWTENSTYTDDTVCTVAIADAMLNHQPFDIALTKWGRQYPEAGYGPMFQKWLQLDKQAPYKSWGNGAVMRLSPICYLSPDCTHAILSGLEATGVTHNTDEALSATEAYIKTFFALKEKSALESIKQTLKVQYGYDMNRSIDEIRKSYNKFYVRCSKTVPEAITCVLEATGFEDAIRNAISLGGDSDTLAAMTGALAEVRFNVPAQFIREAQKRLPVPMKRVLDEMYRTPRQIIRQVVRHQSLSDSHQR